MDAYGQRQQLLKHPGQLCAQVAGLHCGTGPTQGTGQAGDSETPALCWAGGQPGQATEGRPPNCKAGSN